MTMDHVEATAPCRVELAGTGPGPWPVFLMPPGPVAVNVGIDRRASCRLERAPGRVAIESRDSLQKAEARNVEELLARGPSLVGEVLRALDVREGVRVQTQSWVPVGAGLGASSALALAAGAGLSALLGRELEAKRLFPLLWAAEARSRRGPVGPRDYTTALRGGVQAVHLEAAGARVESLSVDPARIEESLLLIDAGDTAPGARRTGWEPLLRRAEEDREAGRALSSMSSIPGGVRQALVDERLDDVVGLLRDEWEARKVLDPTLTTPDVDRVAEVAAQAGGAARLLSAGGRAVMAIWAPPGARGPGRREAVTAALAAAGFKVFPARVDLRGLETG